MNQNNNLNQEKLLFRIKELEAQIRTLKSRRKYGLVWEDKPEDVVSQCIENVPVLKEIKSRKITTKNLLQNNLLVEGDNYHTLSVLNYTHKGKIDVIYIDPPYNTGNKDFTYWDNFKERYDSVKRDDDYKHSKWLSFMKRRLLLSRDLISENGLIFISIDDNEHAQLKLLCDSILGNNNYLNTFIWINNLKGRQISDLGASKTYEYILVYSKNALNVSAFEGDIESLKKMSPEVYKNKDYEVLEDELGEYVIKNELYNSNSDFNEETRPNLVFDIFYNPKSKKIKFNLDKSDIGYVKISPNKNNNGRNSFHAWRWGKDKVLNENYNLEFIKNNDTYKIYTKIRDLTTTNVKDIITNITTNSGSATLSAILGKKTFSFPKPLDLIKFLLSFSTSKTSTVLDFFAGSGTTGHAVLELNKQDGGTRKFILCTNNENNICEEITYERLKRVINGYQSKKDEKVEGLGGNLSYYKTDLVNIEKLQKVSDEDKIKVTYQAGEMIAVREDTLNEVEKSEWWQIFEGNGKVTAIYFKEDKAKLRELIATLEKNNLPTVLYIFGWGKNEFRNEYSTKNIKIEDIPEPILEVYKEINRL